MFTLNCKGRMLVTDQPLVMGILNVTPDSFYSGSRLASVDDVIRRAATMIEEGADILDIGGQSTRPGSEKVSAEEELERVIPAIEAIHQRFPDQILSVDTFYSRVAAEAVASGASMINDISAGTLDGNMLATVAVLQVPYVLMHMKGAPQTMQDNPVYNNVTLDVFDELNFKLAVLRSAGIHDIIIDPGFGFGKTTGHNFQLLKELSFFRQMNCPLLVGLSRKATVYKTLGIFPEQALNGTTVLHTIALMNGADMLRVHDVKEAKEAVVLVQKLRN